MTAILKEKNNLEEKIMPRFKNMINNPYNNKIEQLEKWLDKETNLLETENNFFKEKKSNINLQKKYFRFDRGIITKVDFGVNIGSELSNPHFVIVLEKNDSIKNGNLLVVPLSSKSGKYHYPLANLIGDNLQKKTEEIQDKLLSSLNTLLEKSEFEPQKYKEEIRNIKSGIEQCKNLISDYSKYSNNSYACLNQIRTIAKERIYKPTNKFDLIGRVKCSKLLLEEIDFQILKIYTEIEKKYILVPQKNEIIFNKPFENDEDIN